MSDGATKQACNGVAASRRRRLGLMMVCGLALATAFAFIPFADAQTMPDGDAPPAPSWHEARRMALAHLFDDLKSARTEDEAARIVTQIDGQFRQSGSDTLDLLAAHAREAMSKGEFPVAVEIISRVIAMQADWAEAWNERASVFFMMGDYDRAKADIIEALSREPRQIGALTGLALIYEVQDQPKEALKAYRQVLALAPQLKPVKSAVARLAKEFEQPM